MGSNSGPVTVAGTATISTLTPSPTVSSPGPGRRQKEVETGVPANDHSTGSASGRLRYLGQFLAIVHVLCISFAAVIIKGLPYHPFSCGIWRFAGVFWPYFIVILCQAVFESKKTAASQEPEKCGQGQQLEEPQGVLAQIRAISSNTKVATLLLVRGLCSTVAAILIYNAFKYISIADAIVLTSTEPIFVKLVAYFWLKEPCGLMPILFAILSVFGIVIVARPPLITGEEEFNVDTMIGLAFASGCLICSTMIVTIVRYLRTATRLHFAIIISVPGICGTVVCLTLALAVGVAIIPETLPHVCFAVVLAMLACLEQITITFALKFEAAGPISIIKTMIVIFSFLWEFLFFGKVPDAYSLIGAGIVIFCVIGTVFHKWIHDK